MKTIDDLLMSALKDFRARLRATDRNDGKAIAVAHYDYQILKAKIILSQISN